MVNNKNTKKILAIRGMNDILPSRSFDWFRLENILFDWLHSYGYSNIRVPILEQTSLFQRGIGEVTDIVEKEMYSFRDSYNNDSLTMRPEITAGIVRATIEHNILYERPRRLYSLGPVFRHERPQLGRYRQFHQVDVEAVGFEGPDLDAELMIMVSRLWEILGIKNVRLEVNCLGSYQDRLNYKEVLLSFFEKNIDHLDEISKKRLYSNPLRILDSKNPVISSLMKEAPVLLDFLSDKSLNYFDSVCDFLKSNNIQYYINNRLVRGLDYYNLTVFEWTTDKLGSQGTVCGGGRYDNLFSMLGGKDIPAAGFAIGFERLIELWNFYKNPSRIEECDIYITHRGLIAQKLSFNYAEKLRDAGFKVIVHCGLNDSLKRQFRMADLSNATLAIVFGEDEVANNFASIKLLRVPHNYKVNQEKISIELLIPFLKDKIKK
ncbi:MAG: histidine--tRNA ligase [Candidatus Kinetoplastibacterium crithidii]|nr:MAG: histidine--tRNA ligase [Candidatus Kinetoplastibacterium crithidii]